ncbi:MAG: prolipoprotein diacylglyceryl transferase [Deltaproteobacteria bacterium]|nr:prolipoprotein diacylglyceryl transferase [Deltaproteobacteria bacterium]
MFPVLSIGPFDLPPYFTFLMIGYLAGVAISVYEGRRLAMNGAHIVDVNLAIFLASLVGARVGSILFDGSLHDYINACFAPERLPPALRDWDCFESFRLWRGGMQYYGGFIGGGVAAAVMIRVRRLPIARAFDLWGYGVPAGLVFGRFGCLLAGCCYGQPSAVPWAISFPAGSAAAKILGVAPTPTLHPTQLYELVLCLAIFSFNFFFLRKRARRDGAVWWAFCLAYAVGRFAIEFLRDDPRGEALGLSTSQWIAVAVFIVGVVAIRRYRLFSGPDEPKSEPPGAARSV